uniref:KIB1-4 beta-propeller domain-containing protein n=1 Tax=Solanum lycopersicum TaxID=4081 RepID=A0A3Q7HSV0_SOLLC
MEDSVLSVNHGELLLPKKILICHVLKFRYLCWLLIKTMIIENFTLFLIRKLHVESFSLKLKGFQHKDGLYTGIGDVTLLHPFSRTQIHLPPASQDKDAVIDLAQNPSLTSDYVLLISYFEQCNYYFAFWRPGDQCWTIIASKNYGPLL